jgi:hypothetical protein
MYNNSRNETGFTTSCSYDKTFHAGSTIVLTIPSFNLFITGDWSFYANVLGSEPGSYTAEKWTCEFLNSTFAAIVGSAKEISNAVRDILLRKKDKVALTQQYTIK